MQLKAIGGKNPPYSPFFKEVGQGFSLAYNKQKMAKKQKSLEIDM